MVSIIPNTIKGVSLSPRKATDRSEATKGKLLVAIEVKATPTREIAA